LASSRVATRSERVIGPLTVRAQNQRRLSDHRGSGRCGRPPAHLFGACGRKRRLGWRDHPSEGGRNANRERARCARGVRRSGMSSVGEHDDGRPADGGVREFRCRQTIVASRLKKKPRGSCGASVVRKGQTLNRCGKIPARYSSRSLRNHRSLCSLCTLCSLCSLCNLRNRVGHIVRPVCRRSPCRTRRTCQG
jgi:hypothetical protein